MKNKKYILNLCFTLCLCLVYSQETILCSSIRLELKIENTSDVPVVSSNTNETLNLNFPQQYITDIFENYDIYEFNQTFPTGSEELQKYYHFFINSKGVIEDVMSQVPTTSMTISDEDFSTISLPFTTPLNSELIQFVDGNTFSVTKYSETSDAGPCFNCPLIDVPETFNFKINFTYEASNDVLHVETEEETSCGHSFHIALKGGNPNGFIDVDNILQLWESYPTITTEIESTESCFYLESLIFNIFDIACSPLNAAYDNTFYTIESEEETLQLDREHAFFGSYTIELSKANLSINQEHLSQMRPYTIKGNPYLQIANLNEEVVSINLFNSLGQLIFSNLRFENNSVNLSNFETGLYFVKLSTLNNQQKTFKLLLN